MKDPYREDMYGRRKTLAEVYGDAALRIPDRGRENRHVVDPQAGWSEAGDRQRCGELDALNGRAFRVYNVVFLKGQVRHDAQGPPFGLAVNANDALST